MRKIAHIEKLGNGIMLTVDQENGAETQFFIADDGGAASRTLAQAYDMAAGTSSKRPYHEPAEEPEAHRSAPEQEPEIVDDEELDDDGNVVSDARHTLGKFVGFVQENPGVGEFLGSLLNGANSLESKRHRMKQAERDARKKR